MHRFVAAGAHLYAAGLGLLALLSFLAISYSSEARAPGREDEVAAALPLARMAGTPEPIPDLGPTSTYLEPPLVLALSPEAEAAMALALLMNAPRMIQPPPPRAPLDGSQITGPGLIHGVNLTFYDCADQGFCGPMSNGEPVYEGAAACSWNMPTGTAFSILGDPTERIYVCKDRGLLADTWVDIFWYYPDDGYDWQAAVGRYGSINIVYVP